MPDLLELVTDAPTTYLAVVGLVALDAVLPVAPSETLLAAAGVLVAEGELSFALAVLAGATGALIGHTVLYLLGRRLGPPARRRLFRSETSNRRLDRGAALLAGRTWLLIVADFLPAGRTVAMFAAGGLGLPARRFYSYVVPGAFVWSAFYVSLGIAGGTAFERSWPALIASISAALAIAAGAELYSRRRG